MRKKILSLLILTAIAFAVLGCFAGCGSDELKGSITIVLDNQAAAPSEFEVNLEDGGFKTNDSLLDLLFYLAGNNKIDFEFDGGSTGAYIQSISTVPDAGEDKITVANGVQDNKYVYIYTSVERDQDVSAYKKTYTYKSAEYVNSGFGVSHMHLEPGAVVIFTYIVW